MHPVLSPGARRACSLAVKSSFLVLLGLGIPFTGRTQTVAFPGALGFGAYATGGRNGTVFHVTTLTDTYPTVTPGSFRDAVAHSGRTIVFDVGGTINLVAAVSCSSSLTIAGQTAPGGICLDGGELGFSDRSNIICRYLRVRPGSNTSSSGDDCVGMSQTTNCIMDHMSLEFGPWNNIDAVTANNISVQNCIDANPTGQQFGAHTENVGAFYSWQYNIFANSHNRNPLAKINDTFINNLEYNNAAGYTTHTSTPFKHDIVNNYFIAGPASGGDFPWYQVDKNQSIYYTGNLYDGDKNGTLNGSTTTPYWYQGVGTVLAAPWSSWTTVIPTMSPDLAERYDLSTSGAFPRDDVDSLLISQIQTLGSGTSGTGIGTSGPGGGLYTSQAQTGLSNNGYGTLTGLTALADTDGDGMPDYWELATGSNPNVANPLTNTVTGYTLLENYLNFLAAPHAVTQTNTPVDLNLRQFTTGFAASATFSLTNATNGSVSLVSGTNAHFIPTANFSGLAGFTFTVTEGTYSLSAVVTVCVTPTNPPTAAIAFNGALITAATNAAASSPSSPPSNLLWRGDGVANTWNASASNWLNGASASAFKNSDVVTFDDTGSASPAINLTTTVSPGTIIFNDNQNYTLAGNGSLSGTASLSKTGTGTLTVTATNSSYSGAIIVNGGALIVGPSASIGTGSFNLSGGATLSTSLGGNLVTIPGAITVAAGSSATLGSGGQFGNEYSGNILSGDTNSVLFLNNGISFNGSASSQFSGFTGTINIPSTSTLRFAVASSGNTFGSLNPSYVVNGTLQPRNGGNTVKLGSISGSGKLTGQQTQPGSNNSGGVGNVVYNIGGNNLDSTFSGTIIDSNPTNLTCLVKSGTGKLTLTGANTFTGSNAVTAGTLFINGSSASLLTTVAANAALGGTGVISGPVAISSGGILSPGGSGVGTLTINGNLTDNSPIFNYTLSGSPSGANDLITMTGTLAMTGAQTFNFTLAGNALGAGIYNLIQGATGSTASSVTLVHNLPGNTRQTLSLSRPVAGSNPSYIQLNVSGTAASLVWSGANGGTWDLSTTPNWLNGGSPDVFYNLDGVTFNDSGANPSLTLAANVDPAFILVSATQNYTFGGTGALFGNGALTKSGSGTLTINTTNSSYTGNVFVYGGTIAIGNSANIGSGTVTISNGATFSLPPSGNSVFLGGPVFIPAGQTANLTSGLLSSGFSGNFSAGDNTSVLNIFGGVSFSGANSAQFDGFAGTINMQAGSSVRLSPNSSGNTFGSLSPVWVINGTLQPRNAGNTIQLGAFTGSGVLAGANSASGTGDTIYVIGGNNSDATFAGVISSNSAVAGTDVDVNKIGTGRLTLSGSSTYGGGTTVNAGTLRVNNLTGSGTGSGALEVFSGAVLTGNGFIGGATTLDDGAILAPGDPNGTLTLSNNLTLNDNTLLQFGLGTSSDSVTVGGDLFLTGRLTVTNTAGFGPGTYTLFTCGGTLTFDDLVLVSAPSGYNYTIDTTTPGVVKLVVALPPPPAFGGVNVTGNTLTLSGSNGRPYANYYVLQSSNLTMWTSIATNQFDSNGGFSFTTNAPAGSMQNFYRLQLP